MVGIDIVDTTVGLGHQSLCIRQALALLLALFDHLEGVHCVLLGCPDPRCLIWIDLRSGCYQRTLLYPIQTLNCLLKGVKSAERAFILNNSIPAVPLVNTGRQLSSPVRGALPAVLSSVLLQRQEL